MSKHKSKKDKKRKGHVEANLTITRKEALENDLEPVVFWDDWKDWRDGMRNVTGDRSRFHPEDIRWCIYDVKQNNRKLKKQLQIRRFRMAYKTNILGRT